MQIDAENWIMCEVAAILSADRGTWYRRLKRAICKQHRVVMFAERGRSAMKKFCAELIKTARVSTSNRWTEKLFSSFSHKLGSSMRNDFSFLGNDFHNRTVLWKNWNHIQSNSDDFSLTSNIRSDTFQTFNELFWMLLESSLYANNLIAREGRSFMSVSDKSWCQACAPNTINSHNFLP